MQLRHSTAEKIAHIVLIDLCIKLQLYLLVEQHTHSLDLHSGVALLAHQVECRQLVSAGTCKTSCSTTVGGTTLSLSTGLNTTDPSWVDNVSVGEANGDDVWQVGAKPVMVRGHVCRNTCVSAPVSRSWSSKPSRAIRDREKGRSATSTHSGQPSRLQGHLLRVLQHFRGVLLASRLLKVELCMLSHFLLGQCARISLRDALVLRVTSVAAERAEEGGHCIGECRHRQGCPRLVFKCNKHVLQLLQGQGVIEE